MPDISQLTPFATSTPEQAASNIQNANVFSLNPVPDKSFNEQASQQIEDMTKPTYAAPAVKDYMSQSTEHTALALPDTPKLNFIDETAKYIGDIVYNRPTDDQKIVDLNLKKMQNGGQLSDDDNYQLWQLNQDRIEQQKNTYNEPPSFIEKVGEAVLDTGRTLRRHAPLIGAFTGAGAAIGEFTPFGPAGAVAGAGAGFGAGIMSAFSVDAYDSLAGGTYNELSNMTKEDGTPMKIDESTKANISHGVGAIGAAVNAVLGKALVDTTPFIKSVISPSMAKNLILNPANAALLKTVTNIGEVALTGAGAGAATETSRIIAEEMGKTYDGSQASFLNALAAAGDHLKANAERVGGAAAVGAATGAALAGATGALGFGRTKANFEQRSRYTVRAAMDEYFGDHSAGARDVAPTVPEGGPLQIAGSRDVTPANPDAGPSVGPSAPENSITQSTKVLQLRDAMEDMSTAANQTKMKELAPGEMADVMKGVFSRAGISKLYTTLQNLRDFSVDPEKGKAARNLLDPSGYFASQVDAPIEVDPVKVMEVAHDHPEILDHMKVQPDGPSAMQAKQYLESLQAASQKHQEIFTKLGIKPEDVQPEPQSNVTQMPAPKDKGEAVPFDFEGSVKRTDEILQQLQPSPAPNLQTVYHGTNRKFDDFNYDKGGGMVHFAEKPEDAWKYAQDTGSGGRGRLKDNEVELRNNEEEMPNLKWDEKLKAWASADKKIVLSREDMRDMQEEAGGRDAHIPWDAVPVDARTIEHPVDMSKVLDTRTKEGLEKLVEILKPTNRRAEEFINAAKRDLEDGKIYRRFGGGFGHSFWSLTKMSRGDEINKSLKEVTKQLQDAGYHGIRFVDDSHMTVAMFDPKNNLKPDNSVLEKELEGIKQQVADHFKSQQPGDLLIRPDAWDEPNIDMTRKVASEYVNAPTFSEVLQKAFPKVQLQKYNIAQQNARMDYATRIRESAEYEMDKVQDIQVEEAKQVRKQQEIDRIANDPNYAIVDRFRRDVISDAKGKKGHSIYSIDPRSLPKELEPYLDNARLKEHKVFAKGGITADDAAQMLGVKNGAELLSILSKTPTREQVAKARAAAFAASDEQEARDSVDLNNTRTIQFLRDQTKAHLAEMKFMREHEWPATKAGIKLIALPLPKIEELTQQARDQVKRTKIGSLNARQFEVGERKSNKIAFMAILKNEVEKADFAKKNAALNSELEKETKIATAEFNRAARFFRKFNEKGTQQILKDAGSLYVNAANEIRGVFNLSPSAGESAELGSYQKYVKKMVDEGKGDFSIPEALSDIRQSVNDLTVEQVRVLHDRLAALLSQAKFKNKLIAKHEALAKEAKAEDVERFANEVVSRLADHPGNSDNRLKTGRDKSVEEYPVSRFDSIENLFTAKQFIYKQLDRENPGGWFYHNFDAEIEGSGEYFEKSGYTKDKKMTKAAVDKINKITEAHGNFDHEMGKILQIPEFKSIKELNNGWLSKGDLAMLWAYRGQQYTKDLLFKNNGNVGDETWNKVFFRELDKKDFVAIQKLVDTLKDYHPEVIARMKRSGRDPHIIQGIPNQISDTESTAGGYVRARYQHAFVKNRVEKLTWEDTGDRPANELTDEGYLKTRSGSGEPLDYSLRGLFLAHAEIIHDLSYSEPLENFKKKIENEDIRAAIIKAVGEPKLNTVIDKNLQIGNRLSQNGDYFRDADNVIKKGMNILGNNFASAALSFNPSTPIIQLEALGEMARVLGPKSLVHLTRINAMLIKNVELLPGFIDAAMKLDPNLEKYFTGVADRNVSAIDDLVPKKKAYGKTTKGKVLAFAKNNVLDNFLWLDNMLLQGGFLGISGVDAMIKALQAHTVYQMVREGDFPNYPKERLEKMTPKEIHEAGQAAAQQMSSLTMIQGRKELQAPIQDLAAMKAYTFFWNYQRNILNNQLGVARKVAWEVKKGTGPVGSLGGKGPSASGQREGIETRYTNYEDHGSGGWKMNATKIFIWSAACSMAMLYLHKIAHGQKWNPADDQDLKTAKGVAETGKNILADLAMSQIDLTTNATPVLNTTVYAAQHKKKYQLAQVTNPETQILTAFATTMGAVYDMTILSKPMSRMERRAALESLGYTVGFPVSAWNKGTKWLDKIQSSGSSDYLSHFQQAQFNTSQIDNQQKDLKAFAENPPEGADPHFVAQVDQLQKQLAPQTATVPPQANDIVKIAESGGDWSEPNGLYGFSSSDWKTIMRSAPELGLTENGRTAKDTTQQEKAIDWSLHENAQRLAEKDLPVNNQTLFGAHKLGVENYIKVFNAGANEKLKSVLDEGALKQNPEIANFKTIGQVKLYLNSKVDSARKVVEKDNSLTSNAPNTED